MDIKITFFNSTNNADVESRRFKFDAFAWDLKNFLSHVKQVFKISEIEPVYVQWKAKNQLLLTEDEWNDFKASNVESNSAVKLHLYRGHLHKNVTCDICENLVVGDRYKCLQCEDFDICQLCFQSDHNIHKKHCFLLLRTPEDALKFLTSIPSPRNMGCDFRVIDMNLSNLIIDNSYCTSSISTQTIATDTDEKSTNCDEKQSLEPKSTESDELFDSSVTEQYYKSLPKQIHEAIDVLRSMGFKNISSTIIAVLIAHNGNIFESLEEIEYSQKH